MTGTLAPSRRSRAAPQLDAAPRFEVFAPEFEAVLGSAPRLVLVAETDAHEGPVYVPGEDALYFMTVPQAADSMEAGEPGRPSGGWRWTDAAFPPAHLGSRLCPRACICPTG